MRRAWRGEAEFWPVYNAFGAFGTLAVVAIYKLLFEGTTPLDFVGAILMSGYFTWAGALLWRCASNVRGFGVFIAPLLAFSWFCGGIIIFGVIIWLGLANLGLPVGFEQMMGADRPVP